MTTALDVSRLGDVDTATIRAELARVVAVTAEHLVYAAALWRELESRGDDLSDYRSGFVGYLPLIAAGAVLAAVVARLIDKPFLCRVVAALPVNDQEALLERGAVPLAVYEGGQYTHRMIPLPALTRSQVRVVFGDRCVRSPSEQIAVLTAPPPVQRPIRIARQGRVEVDRATGLVRIGRSYAPSIDVLAALRKAGLA